MAGGYNDVDFSTARLAFGITLRPQRDQGSKVVFQLRTAKYQDALEPGKLAARTRDFAVMDKWLAQFGKHTLEHRVPVGRFTSPPCGLPCGRCSARYLVWNPGMRGFPGGPSGEYNNLGT
jgi:hypothetical protein